MTDRDKTELPPEWLTVPAIQAWADARARDAVIAALDLQKERTAKLQDTLHDLEIELARCRKERDAARAEQAKPAKPAKPKVHSERIELFPDGSWTIGPGLASYHSTSTMLHICWTDDGRAWIESERNRELAASLRRGWDFSVAADALDGGTQ